MTLLPFLVRRSPVGAIGQSGLRALMPGISEVQIGFQWLTMTLSTIPTLPVYAPGGVWRSLAPPSTAMPYVIMGYQAGTDVLTMNAYRVMSDLLYQVKVVGPASLMAQIVQAYAQIDQLIGGPVAPISSYGGLILSCDRQSALHIDEIVNGQVWTNLGGLYRIIIEQH